MGAGSLNNFKILNIANLGGLSIGKPSSTTNANVTISNPIAIVGPVAVYGGDISVNANLTITNSNADVLLKASGDISLAAGKAITTSGGNVVLWANSDAQTANGAVLLRNGSSITTGSSSLAGGHLWVGGGSSGTTWQGLSVGNGYAVPGTSVTPTSGNNIVPALYLENVAIDTFGGDIKMASDVSGGTNGFITFGTNTLDAGAGQIEVIGAATNTTSNRLGFLVGIHAANVTGAALNLKSSADGVAVKLQAGSAGTSEALHISGTLNIESSGSGAINIDANPVGTGKGIVVGGYYDGILNAFAASGDITVDGGIGGVHVQNGSDTAPALTSKLNVGKGGGISSSSSDVFVIGDKMSIAAGGVAVDTIGALTVAPLSDSFSSALTWPVTSFSAANITGLTLGKASNTANVTIASAASVNGPVAVYGGDIAINANLTSTAVNADVLLKASGNIATGASVVLQTNMGDITLWSDSDAASGGSIVLADNVTLNATNGLTAGNLSGGGKIVLAGGLDDGSNNGAAADGVPDGFASSATGNGIKLGAASSNHTQMYSGGGDIVVRGSSTNDAGTTARIGVWQIGNWTANSGNGAISIAGDSAHYYAVNFVNTTQASVSGPTLLSLISNKSSGDAISISGDSGGSHGVVFNYDNPKEIFCRRWR